MAGIKEDNVDTASNTLNTEIDSVISEESSTADIKLSKNIKVEDIRQYPFRPFDNSIFNKKELKILCNDAVELTVRENNRLTHKVLIICTTVDGSKLGVLLDNIDVYFDVMIPIKHQTKHEAIENDIKAYLDSLGIYLKGIKTHDKKYYRGFNTRRIFKRLYFATANQRSKAISTFYDDTTSPISRYGCVLCNDDKASQHLYKTGRDYELTFSSTAIIKNFTRVGNPAHYGINIPTVRLDVNDFKKETFPIQDRSIMCAYDIETTGSMGADPDPNDPTQKIFMIAMIFYYANSDRPLQRVIITDKAVNPSEHADYIILGDGEEGVIKGIINVMNAMKPDFGCHFNGYNFDMPFIVKRVEKYKMVKQFLQSLSARDIYSKNNYKTMPNSVYRDTQIKMEAGDNNTFKILNVPGYCDIDLMVEYSKIDKKASNPSLSYFAEKNKLGSKDDLPYQEMWNIYHKGDPEEMKRVVKYNVIDSELCQKLLTKRFIVSSKRDIANDSFVNTKHAFYYADGVRLINLLAYEYALKGYVMSIRRVNKNFKLKYKGGHVFPPTKGVWKDKPIFALDFASLYPNLMISGNKSFDTLIKHKSIMEALKEKGYKFHYQKIKKTVVYDNGMEEVVEDEGWFIDHENDPEKFGVLAALLLKKFNERLALKLLKIKYEEIEETAKKEIVRLEAENKSEQEILQAILHLFPKEFVNSIMETNPTLHEFMEAFEYEIALLDFKQITKKVFMNSYYGKCGDNNDCLAESLISGSTTKDGRTYIKKAAWKVTEHGCIVRYGDTDSIYSAPPDEVVAEAKRLYAEGKLTKKEYCAKMIDDTIAYAKKMQEIVNKMFEEITGYQYIKMAYEETGYPSLLVGRKMYAFIQHMKSNNLDNWRDNLFLRGLSMVRRGTTLFQNNIAKECLFQLLDFEDEREAWRVVHEYIKNEIFDKKWGYEFFAKTYKYKPHKKNISVLLFANRMKEKGIELEPGIKFRTVVTKKKLVQYDGKGRTFKLKMGDRMEMLEYAQDKGLEIDLEYYIVGPVTTTMSQYISYYDKFKYTPTPEDVKKMNKSELVSYVQGKEMDNAGNYLVREVFSEYFEPEVNNHKVYKDCFKFCTEYFYTKFGLTAIKEESKKTKYNKDTLVPLYAPEECLEEVEKTTGKGKNKVTTKVKQIKKEYSKDKTLYNLLFDTGLPLGVRLNSTLTLENIKEIKKQLIPMEIDLPFREDNIIALSNYIRRKHDLEKVDNVKKYLAELPIDKYYEELVANNSIKFVNYDKKKFDDYVAIYKLTLDLSAERRGVSSLFNKLKKAVEEVKNDKIEVDEKTQKLCKPAEITGVQLPL